MRLLCSISNCTIRDKQGWGYHHDAALALMEARAAIAGATVAGSNTVGKNSVFARGPHPCRVKLLSSYCPVCHIFKPTSPTLRVLRLYCMYCIASALLVVCRSTGTFFASIHSRHMMSRANMLHRLVVGRAYYAVIYCPRLLSYPTDYYARELAEMYIEVQAVLASFFVWVHADGARGSEREHSDVISGEAYNSCTRHSHSTVRA